MFGKRNIIILSSLVIIAVLIWAFNASTKPLPGDVYLWNSRTHLPEGTQIDYKHNIQPNLSDNEPPTSGDHYPSWITKGFYDTPRPDGNLVHSQEHGYILIWYNCEIKPISLIPTVYAQIQMTSGSEGSASATLAQMPKAFSDGSCDGMKNQIKAVISNLGDHKMIAVPRMGMDSQIILTAWGRIEKLKSVDQAKIQDFVNAYRDNGPEPTVEP